MQVQALEVSWLDARETVTLSQLCEVCAMNRDELDELVDYGALTPMNTPMNTSTNIPLDQARSEKLFSAECIMPLRTADQLRQDFDLDLFTVALVLGYLGRIAALEHKVRFLKAYVPDHVLARQHDD